MAIPFAIEPERTAVLAMDLQPSILLNLPDPPGALLGRAAHVLDAARAAGIPVVYVMVGFRPGHPEVSPRNPLFSAAKQAGRLVLGDPATAIHPAVAPREGEVVVVKKRVGAFSGSDLDAVLRARGVDTLVLFGVATGGVVVSTVRLASDLDYRLVVVGDCCADRDPEVHRCLVEKLLPRQAAVVSADEIVGAMGA
jgi:nicotinamidase-related amidase